MLLTFKIAFGDRIFETQDYNLNTSVNIFLDNIKNTLKREFNLYNSNEIQIIPVGSDSSNIPLELMNHINPSNVSLYTYLINNNSIDNNSIDGSIASFYVRPIYMFNNKHYHLTLKDNNKYYIENEELEQVKNGNLNINEIHYMSEQQMTFESPVIIQPLVIEQPSANEQNECIVCYSTNTESVLSRYYNCCHEICDNCFSSWHNTSHFTCPLCRQAEI